jgi:membrane-bound serine protease (ClpP class)
MELNTPGGLLKSTRAIVSELLASPIPIIVYVAPAGAHAGSAGVFITLAGHIAAMAPATNIGAAHPVGLQGQADAIMNEKATNDAAAFIRTIAERRNRNLTWAEEAVRNSVSVTETEALKDHIIDIIALDIPDLLQQLDGREIYIGKNPVRLQTKGSELIYMNMSLTEKILDKISDPSITYILMLLGFFGLLFELYNPGAILPGIIGVISLILAFYALHTLPVNYAGLLLIIFAIILFLLEIKIVTHGLLAIGGTVSLLIGSLMLIRPDSPLELASISHTVIITSSLITALFFLGIIGIGIKAQRAKPVTGIEGMISNTGEVIESLNPIGLVKVRGEIWQAISEESPIEKGEHVRIIGVQDLKVRVIRSTS